MLDPRMDSLNTFAMSSNLKPEEVLEYYGISGSDVVTLRTFRPHLEDHIDKLVAAFYRHLLSFNATHEFLTDSKVRTKLIGKQKDYLLSLGDPIDEKYIKNRHAVGLAHRRIGLQPQLYLGAYSLYLSLLQPIISNHYSEDREQAERTYTAFSRVLILDASLAIQAYEEKKESENILINKALASESTKLTRSLEKQEIVLRQTKERAQAAAELATIGEMVSGLAHEIGTPMNVILSHVEMLESSVRDEPGEKRLGIIQDQIDRITKSVRSFLDMARPDKPVFSETTLQEVVENALVFIGETLRKREIQIQTHFESAPLISADAKRLQQLFLNLFVNAIDAIGEDGELSVTIKVSNHHACLSIQDNGHGISPKDLPHLFEPFFTTKAAGHGSGLGLAVAKTIIEEHQGSICARSAPGEGSTFIICIPSIDYDREKNTSEHCCNVFD